MPPENVRHEGLAELREIHRFEKVVDSWPRSVARNAVQLGVNQHVFLGGQFRIGRERLRNHADGRGARHPHL